MTPPEDEAGALEQAKARLYGIGATGAEVHKPLSVSGDRVLPHTWEETPLPDGMPTQKKHHIRFASMFFSFALLFFVVSLGVAGYFFYFGGNTVSSDKITLEVQGPTTIAGGDTVPLQLSITNRNPTTIEDATLEISFPESTRNASSTLEAYPRYLENLGSLASGETVKRSVRAVIFGGAGSTLSLPISLSYKTGGSNATFVKKTAYTLGISSTPLEVSIDSLTETVAGKPLMLTLTVRSNATVPLSNVVLAGTFPFGFTPTSSSVPLSNTSFLLGTLEPGAVKAITLTGTLTGQESEQRAFRFSVGTAKSPSDQSLAVTYMSVDRSVGIAAPFINTKLTLNGEDLSNAVVTAGSRQNVTVSYANTLPTSISNVTVSVALSGTAIDYSSVSTSRGFYRSLDRTVIFSQDKDASLSSLAPGASGIGSFNFEILPPGSGGTSPSITFTTSVSGTRVGQSNVPETVNATVTKTIKVLTAVALTATSLHASGPIANTGPIPPAADQVTTYSVLWSAKNQGSTVAGGTVTATLPSYVTYTGKTTGNGTFSYNSASRTVTWSLGDLAQGGTAQGVFQVALTPSSSQKNSMPSIVGAATFSGFDRFAGVAVKAGAGAVTTETKADPGYVSANGSVQ